MAVLNSWSGMAGAVFAAPSRLRGPPVHLPELHCSPVKAPGRRYEPG